MKLLLCIIGGLFLLLAGFSFLVCLLVCLVPALACLVFFGIACWVLLEALEIENEPSSGS